MVEEDGRVPRIDVGTPSKIRDGSIRIRGGIDRFMFDGVDFTCAMTEAFDAVNLATGFQPDLRGLIPDVEGLLDSHDMPRVTGRAMVAPGLYFCFQITVRPASCAKSASRRSGLRMTRRRMRERSRPHFSAR
jgi:hypothetical protein